MILTKFSLSIESNGAERSQRPQGKKEKPGPLRAKLAEYLQGLEINFGILLLV